MLLVILTLGACFTNKLEDTGHDCGPGTHWDGEYCVPDEDTDGPEGDADTDADSDSDTDSDTDADGDTDADTDADGDADADSDADTDPVEDADGDGFTVAEGDCDDGNASVNPDATEICENGVDDNCDGTANECLWDDQYAIGGVAITLAGDRAGERAGCALAGGGDANGDGSPDLLVGARDASEGGADAGKVYLAYGPITADMSLDRSAGVFTGDVADGNAGSSVAFAGDVDGDGFDDILIGAPGDNVPGVAYLFLGPASGAFDPSAADGTWTGSGSEDEAGAVVAGLGDVSGDGVDDFAIGAPGNVDWAERAGGVFVFEGPGTGAGTVSDADSAIYGQWYGIHAGRSLAGGGDLDGDGVNDLAVGHNSAGSYHGSYGTAAVSVFEGPIRGSLLTRDADATVTSASVYVALATEPHTIAIDGDLDGDGYDDLVIGAPEASDLVSNQGAVFVFTGPLAGDTDTFLATARFDGWDSSDRAGCAVATTGDLDGDGGDDLLIGAWAANYTVTTAGAAYLVTGPFAGTSSLGSAQATFLGEDGGYVGYAVSGVGDLTGDGLPDLLVGAILDPGDITGSGAAYLVASDGL